MGLLDISRISNEMAEAWQKLLSVEYIEAWLETMAEIVDEMISLGVCLRRALEEDPAGMEDSQRVQGLLESLHQLLPYLREQEMRSHLAKELSSSIEATMNRVSDQLQEVGVVESVARMTLADVAIELARGEVK